VENGAVDADSVALAIAQERALLSVEVRCSAEAVKELLDPEFREVGASGRTWRRTEMLSALATEDPKDETPVHVTEMHGQLVTPGLVLVTYVSERAGRRARRSSLWRLAEDRWRLLYHQGTLTDST
jgi:hypothetical protein